MNSIEQVFQKEKAFIPFITCGDPSLETTKEILYALERAGADMIELGIPFSDPTAEGPTIQKANLRARKNHITTDHIFEMVAEVRETIEIPLLFMTYANIVFSYGVEKFVKRCKQVGICGLILPDVPFEEKYEFNQLCKQYDVAFISMIAPTSKERIGMIARESEGFLYCVSSLGVTGTRSEIKTDIGEMIRLVKEVTNIPCAVGFGISTPEQAQTMSTYADGVIVGSAIVNLCEKYGEACVKPIEAYVISMKRAMGKLNL